MIQRILLIFACGLVLQGCKSNNNINEPLQPIPIMPAVTSSGASVSVPPNVPTVVGLAGSVVTAGQWPVPASNVTLELIYINAQGDQKPLTKITTGPDGHFEFSQKLERGSYLVRINDRRFVGEKRLNNLTRPLQDVVIEVQEKNRSAK